MSTQSLIRGPSAALLVELGKLLFAALLTPLVLVGLILFGVSLIWPGTDARGAAVMVTLVGAAVVIAILILSFVISPIQERKETVAGYTSMRGAHQELPEVLPGTTIVIRQPGADYLSDAQWTSTLTAVPESSRLTASFPARSVLGLQWSVAVAFSIGFPWVLYGHFVPLASIVSLTVLIAAFVVVQVVIRGRRR